MRILEAELVLRLSDGTHRHAPIPVDRLDAMCAAAGVALPLYMRRIPAEIELPPRGERRDRKIFDLRMRGMSVSGIAQKTGLSELMVRSAIDRVEYGRYEERGA